MAETVIQNPSAAAGPVPVFTRYGAGVESRLRAHIEMLERRLRQRDAHAEYAVTVSMNGDGRQEGEFRGQFRGMEAMTAVTTRPRSNTTSPPLTAIESGKGTRGSRISLPLLSTTIIAGLPISPRDGSM